MGSTKITTRGSQAVTSWRKRTRFRLVQRLGGQCQRCGWSGHSSGFDFHHHDDNKQATIAQMIANPRSWEAIIREADKCTLLCAICHRIEHAGDEYNPEVDGPLETILVVKEPCQGGCGRQVRISNRPHFCGPCSRSHNDSRWPSDETLVERVQTVGYTGTGRQIGVSDNAVRKRYNKIMGL